MAALALLFAVHSYQPSPFFVLDEVDAALDNANVAKIAKYIQDHAGPGMQFIVISLKTGLFQGSEALVGIYRDQSANSSKALTLDVSPLILRDDTSKMCEWLLILLGVVAEISVTAEGRRHPCEYGLRYPGDDDNSGCGLFIGPATSDYGVKMNRQTSK